MNNLAKVLRFTSWFNLPIAKKPEMPNDEIIKLRIARLHEEVDEIKEAIDKGDIAGVLDGLIDLEYILHGTTLAFGLQDIYKEAFNRVHIANMNKKRAASKGESKHGTTYDIVKPKGWEPPQFDDLFEVTGGINE